MNTLPSLFFNDTIDAEIESFCAHDPEFLSTKQQFYTAAQEIAKLVGREQYDIFEQNFNAYLYRTADLYYLYGLGLRQEVLGAIGAGG